MTTLTATRAAPILVGDSLRRIAMRELGDALRWIDLAEVNQLRPPYIIDSVDPADRQPATLVYGDSIRIPLDSVVQSIQLPQDVLGIDCALPQGQLTVTDSGDWATIAAESNLAQALGHRLKTPVGDLLAHPAYGCQIRTALGLRNITVIQLMAIGFVRKAIKQEPRVAQTVKVQTTPIGETLFIASQVKPVNRNSLTDFNLVFPFEH